MAAEQEKLGFNGSWSMAVGGMIGGGIFSTLGVVISVSGAHAWISFLLGGLIALATAHSYAALTRHHGSSGGVFTYLHERHHEKEGRIAVWLLLMGYTLTVAVYAFTFGAYLSDALGGPGWIKSVAAVAAIAVLAGVNLLGVHESEGLEIFIVWSKLVILAALAAIGLWHWAPENLAPTGSNAITVSPFAGIIVGAASVFMSYEGFQLLAYDYDDMENPDKLIGKSMILAVLAVMAAYVLVAVGAAMLVGADRIIAQKEVSLAIAGRAAAGQVGFIAVTIAAVFSTASAINATVFSTSRLTRRAAEKGAMPGIFDRTNSAGVPWFATLLISLVAAIFAVVGGLGPLVEAASFVFLAVFALVNWLCFRRNLGPLWIALAGAGGALFSAIVLLLGVTGVI